MLVSAVYSHIIYRVSFCSGSSSVVFKHAEHSCESPESLICTKRDLNYCLSHDGSCWVGAAELPFLYAHVTRLLLVLKHLA